MQGFGNVLFSVKKLVHALMLCIAATQVARGAWVAVQLSSEPVRNVPKGLPQ